jgi:hypothetical protein
MKPAAARSLRMLVSAIVVSACHCGELKLINVPKDAGPQPCKSDADCRTPGLPRCVVSEGLCVQCFPSHPEDCGVDHYCSDYTCKPGCNDNEDCHLGNPSPASQGMDLCNTSTHTCVSCLSYMNCGPGMVCDCNGQCVVPGPQEQCLDCSSPCETFSVSGTGFNTGNVTQLQVTQAHGLGTIPPNMNPGLQQTPWIWIGNHGDPSSDPGPGYVTKIDENTGRILGTFPSNGHGPSRGAMPLDGSFWIGNRCPWDPNNPACSNLTHIAIDGHIICSVGTAADGAPTPFVRGVALDENSDVWFSTWNDHRVHKVDHTTCKAVLDIDYANNPGGLTYAYGLIVDAKGILWNSSAGAGPYVGIDTRTGAFVYSIDNQGTTSYGITVDLKNNVWLAWFQQQAMLMIDAQDHALHVFNGGPAGHCGRGVTIDTNGTVWAAWWSMSGADNYVTKWNTTGYLGAYHQPLINNGVAINGDTYGNVWLAGTLADGTQASLRFPRSISMDNQYDVVAHMTAAYPYSYADLTGLIFRSVTASNPQYGLWTQVFDSGSRTTTWERATWDSTTPGGTATALTFYGAATQGALATAAPCGPFTQSPADLTTCHFNPNEWLGVQIALTTNNVNVQPYVNNLEIYYQR